MPIFTYKDKQLAALNLVFFRNTTDGNATWTNFQDQIDYYLKIVRAQIADDNDPFQKSVVAIQKFQGINPKIINDAQMAIAAMLTALEEASRTGAVDWGECGYASLAQINKIASLALVPLSENPTRQDPGKS